MQIQSAASSEQCEFFLLSYAEKFLKIIYLAAPQVLVAAHEVFAWFSSPFLAAGFSSSLTRINWETPYIGIMESFSTGLSEKTL